MQPRGANGTPRTSAATLGPRPHPRAGATIADQRAAERLRRDLHDRLGPRLAWLEARLELLSEGSHDTTTALDQFSSLREDVSGLVRELRRIVRDEPPEALERFGLESAIRRALDTVALAGMGVRLEVTGEPVGAHTPAAELLYRAVLEGTANVVRHANATRCLVTLTTERGRATIVVHDDGALAHAPKRSQAAAPIGLGLASLRNAARELGGEAHLLSTRFGGTRLVVRVPLGGSPRIRRRLGATAGSWASA